MTTPRYPNRCVAGSQVRGEAWSSDHAWIVNFNNGNVNNNHRNNTAWVRPVRAVSAGECQDAVPLQSLYHAWRRSRCHKKASANQLAFDVRWMDGLLRLQRQLTDGSWSPWPATCFIAQRPKARQIHAPDFSDRVVHHWLVPKLEALYERGFIHDSYANRKGKGTHAAVDRLRQFVRQVHSGQGGGWYLQLDVHNFFNSIHRGVLYDMLKPRLLRAGAPDPVLRTVHALLRYPFSRQGVIERFTAAERDQVPMHKRLENAAPGCGLPIGNLSSQFFANVYLDALDQFVKHTLKAKQYLRYVDDFVLVARDRAQLEQWQGDIEQFLAERLKLKLKADIRLRPLTAGIDFLGYVVFPTHTRVRPRVITHMRQALREWQHDHACGRDIRATPADVRQLRSMLASYGGHLQHANSFRLRQRLISAAPWTARFAGKLRFHRSLEGRHITFRKVRT